MSERSRSVRGPAIAGTALLVAALAVRWAMTGWEWTITTPARRSSLARSADLVHEVKLWLTVRVWSTLTVFLLALAAAVIVAIWTARAHRNASPMDSGRRALPRGWAVAACLVPVVGVVLLPRVHRDLLTRRQEAWRSARSA